ncbi:MAG: DMT family transporter [Clostridiaceae bacterium]|nr:DMT family transporter [Clostridiaceae bacterium]
MNIKQTLNKTRQEDMVRQGIIKKKTGMDLPGLIFIVAAAALFGVLPVFAKTVLSRGTSSLSLVFIRYSLALIFTAIIMLVSKIPFKITRRQMIHLFFFGTCGVGLTSFLLTSSYLYLPIGIATMLHFSYPFFVAVIMAFFKEKFTLVKATAIILAIGGMALMTDFRGIVKPVGIILAVLSGLSLAVYIVAVNKSSIKSLHPFTVFFYTSFCSSVLLGFAVFAWNNFTLPAEMLDWTYIGIIALFCTSISYSLLTAGAQRVNSTTTSIVNMLEPLVSILAGAIFLNETLSAKTVMGCILVFSAIVMIVLKKRACDLI